MENNIRFRNHISVILEDSAKTVGTIVFIMVLNFLSDMAETGNSLSDVLFLTIFLVVAIGLVIGYHALIWARTYISIEDSTLVVERNTLNKKKNTIGLKNISNINLEQNILEMILGTCKLKLDTNSLSTAEETDVKIVLKKADAENFRLLVLAKAGVGEEEQENDGNYLTSDDAVKTPEQSTMWLQEKTKVVSGDIGDIVIHGLCSIRIWTVLFLIGLSFVQIFMLIETSEEEIGTTMVEVVANMVSLFWYNAIIIWSIAREFLKYINFKIERKKDKVFLNYGLFKKVAYSVPVDKINGIKFTQTPIGRMTKRYMVEIVNVGMDDDQNEANTFFLPYAKREKLEKQLHMLLPEFDGCIEIKEEKQTPAIWLLSIPWLILYIIVVGAVYTILAEVEPELQIAVLVAAAVVLVWRTIVKIARFLTRGIKVDEKFLKIVDGGFSKRTLFVKYDKIQYVSGKQCVIAKQFKIQKGTITLLASLKNRIHELPYFSENEMEQLKKYLV